MAKKGKTGRNDPCPCGSGKKYKHCCGQNADSNPLYTSVFHAYSQQITAVKIKLDRYFAQDVKKYRKDLHLRFLQFQEEKKLPSEHEAIFSDWLWFDALDADGKTMAGNYWSENESYMDAPLRECLQQLDKSFLSVFLVNGIEEDRLQVTDLFLEKGFEILIHEPILLKEDDPELILLARRIKLDSINLFSGQVLSLYNTAGQKDFIVKHFHYIQELLSVPEAQLLKNSGEIIYGIFSHAQKEQRLNLNDLRGAALNENEKWLLMEALDADGRYRLLRSSQNLNWYEPVIESAGYSRIIVGDNQVVSCADFLEDILRQEQAVQDFLPEISLQIISAPMLNASPDIEHIPLLYKVLKDKEYEKWLTTPHRELGGKTPKEMLGCKGGKNEVLAILTRFRDTRNDNEQKELVDYMIERVKHCPGE